MATIQERLATRMRWWADHGNLGYDWDTPDRWHFWVGGEVDCSSFVISVCRECKLNVGDATCTRDMRRNFTAHGWRWIPGRPSRSSLRTGDVLLREDVHTAMYVGSGLISQASANERGGTSGGASGDQGRPNGVGETNTVAFDSSYPWDGVLRYEGADPFARTEVPKRGPDEEVPVPIKQGEVHRLYNPYNEEHLYTTSGSEAKSLVAAGWRDEGVMGVAPEGYAVLYRLYNASTKLHMWTDSAAEVKACLKQGKNYSDGSKNGWQYEGEAMIVHVGAKGEVPIRRLYNPYSGAHMLTTSQNEANDLVKAGWKDEGIAFSLDAD